MARSRRPRLARRPRPALLARPAMTPPSAAPLPPAPGRPLPPGPWLHHMGPFLIVGALLATLWGLVWWFTQLQQRTIVEESRQQLRLINTAVAHQTHLLLQGIDSDLRIVDQWLQAHPAPHPQRD